MAEPLPPQPHPEIPQPQSVFVGETPIYLRNPQKMGSEDITSLTILGADKRATEGVGSTVPLINEASRKKGEEGMMVDKPMTNLNDFDEVPWEKVSGLQWTDETGMTHVIPKEDLSLTPPEASPEGIMNEPMEMAPEPEPKLTLPEKPPVLPAKEARDVLETLTEDPNTITIVGLKAYQTRANDLAERSMQKLATPRAQERAEAGNSLWERVKGNVAGLHEFIFTGIWKRSIGGIYFTEKARQYYTDMLKAAETPFAEDAIQLAEARAKVAYERKLADANFVVRAGTKAVDWLRDKVGMRTTIQRLALEEMGAMKASGEIRGMSAFERESKAIRARFGADMETADQFVRKNLGEKLELLDPENEQNKPVVDGIKDMMKRYATGEITDRQALEAEAKQFFQTTLKEARPDIIAEAELYSSSLFDAAETLKTKMSHEAGLANLDEAINSMQIRLGLGQMGEVTSMDPTAVEKGVGEVREVFEWLNRKNVIVPMVFNEATIGSGVAIALSAVNFMKTAPFRTVAAITGPIGSLTGGALAGGLFAGWKEYGQLQRDYMTHLRERESGAKFSETQKRRAWFEKFAVQQRNAAEMVGTLQSSLYTEGALKTALTDDELRSAFATVADLHARKAVSETGPKRIGLIQFTNRETIESERAALDITANKALADLETYLGTHAEQAQTVLGGNTFPEFMEKLTVTQTQVLREGIRVLDAQDDPVKAALGLVSSYAPEAAIVKRRWPFASAINADEKAMGLDAIMDEFSKEARVEAVKYGVKAGAIGMAVGATFQAVASISERAAVPDADAKILELPKPTPDHTATIGTTQYQVPQGLDINAHTDAAGKVTYDAKIDLSFWDNLKGNKDIVIGDDMTSIELKAALTKAGFAIDAPHKAGDLIYSPHQYMDIPGLKDPNGNEIQAWLPKGYGMKFDDATDKWQILDADKHTVASVALADNGEIKATAAELTKLKADLLKEGYTLGNPEVGNVDVMKQVTETTRETVARPQEMMDIKGSDLGEGGLWDHFLKKTDGDHPIASANGMKNLFRLHTFNENNANIDVPGNPNYAEEHLRSAIYGDKPVQEFNIARIPPDAKIEVPKAIFSDDGIHRFSELNDRAITHYEKLIAEGKAPMQALEALQQGSQADKVDAAVLQLGYFGRDSDLPTQAELAPLLKELGATASTTAETTPVVTEVLDKTVDIHRLTLNFAYPEDQPGQIIAREAFAVGAAEAAAPAAETATRLASESAWIPIFIPYREVLERESAEVATPVHTPDSLLSPFGSEDAYLAKESLDARKSPRLTENAEAKLVQSEEIPWYLSQLTPEETQTLEALLTQEQTPIHPEVRAVVIIPTSQLGTSQIYQKLSSYTNQTNADGTPLSPHKVEYVVYDAKVTPPEGSVSKDLPADTKAEVDRFLTDHPDQKVVYVTHTYDQSPSRGNVKRDMTNFALSRIGTLPSDAPDVAIITDNGTAQPIQPTYISSAIDALDANPALDMVSGSYELPKVALEQYPKLFAQHRAFEVMDSLVRHGDAEHVPGVYSGNVGVRAATLAGVGGYNEQSQVGEDRELAWMVRNARGNADTMTVLPTLTATLDPKDTVYANLQRLGLADSETPLDANEVYKDMPWQDMAKKAEETMTKEHLEESLTSMREHMYPTLKATNPQRHEAYFRRTMESMGLPYEIADEKVVITDMSKLGENVAAPMSIEDFGRAESPAIVEATKPAPETARQVLESIAPEPVPEQTLETPTEAPVTTGVASPEVTPAETLATETAPAGTETVPPTAEATSAEPVQPAEVAAPTVTETPVQPTETPVQPAETLASEVPVEQPKAESPAPSQEQLPEGVEDRIKYVLEKAGDQAANVQLTTGELMDYVKSSVELPGARITEGKIVIDGDTVKLDGMKAKTIVGEASFGGTLVTDPEHGLTVKKDTVQLKLPLLARPWQKPIHDSLDNFNNLVLTHLNGRIDPSWKADRIDIVGDKLEVKFAKKTT